MVVPMMPRVDVPRKAQPETPNPIASDNTPAAATCGRIVWMLIGPFVLILATMGIFSRPNKFGTVADFAYVTAIATMMLGRWVEFRTGHAQTCTGEPVIANHIRNYFWALSALGLTVWIVSAIFRTI